MPSGRARTMLFQALPETSCVVARMHIYLSGRYPIPYCSNQSVTRGLRSLAVYSPLDSTCRSRRLLGSWSNLPWSHSVISFRSIFVESAYCAPALPIYQHGRNDCWIKQPRPMSSTRTLLQMRMQGYLAPGVGWRRIRLRSGVIVTSWPILSFVTVIVTNL